MNTNDHSLLTAPGFASLATAIAANLPGEWTVKPLGNSDGLNAWAYYLTRTSDKLTLFIRSGSYSHPNKLEISYNRPRDVQGSYLSLWPRGEAEQISDPSIRVSESKSSQQIAADIVRRLLADAEAVHGLALARIAESNAYFSGREQLAERIAKAAGSPVHYPRNDKHADPQIKLGSISTGGYGTAKPLGDTVNFTLNSIPAAAAERLAAFLAADTFAPAKPDNETALLDKVAEAVHELTLARIAESNMKRP